MSHARDARLLLRAHRYGALCTQSMRFDGYPYASVTPYMTDQDGSLIIHISALAEHTKNIDFDRRVSLIAHNQESPDIRMQGRVTVIGDAHRIDHQPRYLRYFPEAEALTRLDFAFYRIKPVAIRYIGGIGNIHWVDAKDYTAPSFAEAEFAEHVDAAALLAQHCGVHVKDARLAGIDCDGLDLLGAGHLYRLDFADQQPAPPSIAQLPGLLHR